MNNVRLQRVTSQGSHLTSGECWLSQGHPRMISTVAPSSTRNTMVSPRWWSRLGAPGAACLRGRLSLVRGAWDIKFPEEPESTRAETETEDSGASSCTGSKDKVETSGSSWSALTATCGGLTGQFLMKWSVDAQYRVNSAARKSSGVH